MDHIHRTMLAAGFLAAGVFACEPAFARVPRTFTVTLANMAFDGAPKGLHLGDTILWVNKDIFQHSATADDGSFNVDLPPGARAKTRLNKAGVVKFHCEYHPGMRGQLVVGR